MADPLFRCRYRPYPGARCTQPWGHWLFHPKAGHLIVDHWGAKSRSWPVRNWRRHLPGKHQNEW